MIQNQGTRYFQRAFALKEFGRQQLPNIEKQVTDLIKRKEKDPEIIQCLLEAIATLVKMGAGEVQHQRLHTYYMSVKRKVHCLQSSNL